jgi:hypothetical protein
MKSYKIYRWVDMKWDYVGKVSADNARQACRVAVTQIKGIKIFETLKAIEVA